jgi:hypothetical protein
MPPLKEELIDDQPWLFSEAGFRIIGSDYSPKNFGDSVVTLESDFVRVRFLRERGQVMVDVASLASPNKWTGLVFVLEAIRGALPPPRFELRAAASQLRENLPEIIDGLGPKRDVTEAELQRQDADRLRRHYSEVEK